MENYKKDELTEKIIGCCFKAHSELGPGFVEKIYGNAMAILFDEADVEYEREKEFTVYFHGRYVGKFRCDYFVEKRVILELKAVTGIMPVIFRQTLLSYLKASETKTGLLVNFGNKSCIVKRYSV